MINALVHHFLRDSAHRDATSPFLIVGGDTLTFGEADRQSDRVAGSLQAAGVSRGDRVVLMMENSAELVVSLFGVLKAGAAFIVVNPTTKPDKLAYMLNDSGAVAVLAATQLERFVAPALERAPGVATVWWTDAPPPHRPGDDSLRDVLQGSALELRDPGLIDVDLAAIIYTSGSTGDPKGVMLTHRNVCHNAWSISTYIENRHDDVVVCLLPLAFDYGLFQIMMAARVGFAVLLEKSFAFPWESMQRIAAHRVTGVPGVPTIFATILQMEKLPELDLSAVRYLTNTAASLPPAHIRRLVELFPDARVYSMYGLTECTRVSYVPPDRLMEKIDSVGIAMPNTETYVVGPDGRRVPPGQRGELVVRGSSVMRGYWRKPDETAVRLREGEIMGEIVLHTGDEFWADEEGFLYFVGRRDDIFKSKGEKVAPKEIEHVLYELEAIAEAAVVGVEHPIDGMAIKAIVVPRDGATVTENEVRIHCRARLENYMVPRFVEIRDSLPKTESGKIKKRVLA